MEEENQNTPAQPHIDVAALGIHEWYYKEVPHSSFSPDPHFDEFMFALAGPQDIRGQIVNNDFCRETIKWNERIFTGKHEIKPISWDSPKNLNHEIAVRGEQEWDMWQAAISHMPANNDIIPISLPQNPKHQWMYVFLAAGPHISSREAFCGLIKQAYKETHDVIWKEPGNTIAALPSFSYAAAMEILWPVLMVDRYLGEEI